MNPTDGSCWVAETYIVHLAVVGYGGAPDTVSFSTFESSRSPFAVFAAGRARRTRGARRSPATLTAHSGLYAMSSEVAAASG